MSRQPFLPQHKGKHFCFDERGLEANTEAAALIGRIFAEWSRAEHCMAMVMAALLGHEPKAGVAIFTMLSQARLQKQALSAVARVTLNEEFLNLFEAVASVYASIGEERHSLAHGVIGWSSEVQNLTLWISSADNAQYEAEAWFRFQTQPYDSAIHNHAKLEESIYFYTNKCLQRIQQDMQYAKKIVFDLYGLIRQDYSTDSERFRLLCSEPRVAKALYQIVGKRKTS